MPCHASVGWLAAPDEVPECVVGRRERDIRVTTKIRPILAEEPCQCMEKMEKLYGLIGWPSAQKAVEICTQKGCLT